MQRRTLVSALGAVALTVAAAGSALAVGFSAVDGGSPGNVGTFIPDATTGPATSRPGASVGSTAAPTVITVVVEDRGERSPGSAPTSSAAVAATAPAVGRSASATTTPAITPAITTPTTAAPTATAPGNTMPTTTVPWSTTATTAKDRPRESDDRNGTKPGTEDRSKETEREDD